MKKKHLFYRAAEAPAVHDDAPPKLIERGGKKFAPLAALFKLSREMDNATTTERFSVSSDEPVLQWAYFNERFQRLHVRLLHTPEAVDMARIVNGIPLRDGHGGDQVAMLSNPSIVNGKLGGDNIVWSASERAAVLRKDYEAGVRWEASVEGDYADDALEVTGETKDGVPVVRCKRWTPLAAALAVVQPADTTVGFGRSAEAAAAPVDPTKPTTETNKPAAKPIEAPAVVRSKPMPKTPEELAAEAAAQRADIFRMSNEVHKIVRDFTVPQDVADGWLTKLEKGETDLPAIMRETLAKFTRRAAVTTKAIENDPNIQRQLAAAPSGEAPAELADKFNIKRAILSQIPEELRSKMGMPKVDVGLERETQQEMLRVMRQVPGYENYAPRGVMIPLNIPFQRGCLRREITAQGAGQGASLVAQNLRPDLFIDVLRNRLVLVKAGATLLTGLQGDVKIPRKSGAATAGWTNGEVAVANSEMTLEQLTLTPRTVGAYSDMSRQTLLQTTPAIDMLVMDDLLQGTARAAQGGALLGTGTLGQPTGVKARVDLAVAAGKGSLFTVGTPGTPTFAEMMGAENVLGDANVDDDGTIAWITTPRVANKLRTIPRAIVAGTAYNGFLAMKEDGELEIIDSPAFATNTVTKNMALFGRWSDLVIAHWNAFELIVDPYSLSTKGALRIVGLQSMDCQTRYDGAFTYCATVDNA